MNDNPAFTSGRLALRFPGAVRIAIVLLAVLGGVIAGGWYYSTARDQYLDRGVADAQLLLAFTDSYVGAYADVVSAHGIADVPVPATFRARALAAYSAGEGKLLNDRIAMVGVPGHEVATRADDPQLRNRLIEMDAADSPVHYSEVVELGGRSTLRTVFPSIANNQSCVDCHNALEGQTHQWQAGDMMGAFVAERDIGLPLAQIRNSSLLVFTLSSSLVLVLAMLLRKNQLLQGKSRLLRRMADTDPLTDCLNRRAFYDRISRECSGSESVSEDRWLIMLDLDHFKSINDKYGHAVGDQVLAEFASKVRSQIRDSDSFARIGGEEFALLLMGKTGLDFTAVAKRLVRSVETMEIYSGAQRVPVTVSAGMIKVPAGETGWYERCMRLADASLYQAKERGRNRVIVHG